MKRHLAAGNFLLLLLLLELVSLGKLSCCLFGDVLFFLPSSPCLGLMFVRYKGNVSSV